MPESGMADSHSAKNALPTAGVFHRPRYIRTRIEQGWQVEDQAEMSVVSEKEMVPTQRSTETAAAASVEASAAQQLEDATKSMNEEDARGARRKSDDTINGGNQDDSQALSKNQRKKLKRKQAWEDGTEERRAKRRQKAKASKEKKRAAREEALAQGIDLTALAASRDPRRPIKMPITVILDCDFDELMTDTELVSLASQVTRCYSDNRKAHLRSHMVISSFGGKLKERFDTVLTKNHEKWQDVTFSSDDFAAAAEEAKKRMAGPKGGLIAGALQREEPVPADAAGEVRGEVVYLTSDSPNTLTALKPNSVYIIGGIVDKNRHKGLCYKRAQERNMATAKLPIGDYLTMASRAVLTTNHVNEIMLRWLEIGDWAQAFLEVIPKRKGGVLSHAEQGEAASEPSFKHTAEHNDAPELVPPAHEPGVP